MIARTADFREQILPLQRPKTCRQRTLPLKQPKFHQMRPHRARIARKMMRDQSIGAGIFHVRQAIVDEIAFARFQPKSLQGQIIDHSNSEDTIPIKYQLSGYRTQHPKVGQNYRNSQSPSTSNGLITLTSIPEKSLTLRLTKVSFASIAVAMSRRLRIGNALRWNWWRKREAL